MPEVTVRSSVGDQAGAPFDLSTQQGVAELLRQVRSSSLPGATKTTIRELVLRFARDGEDGVREELESILKGVSLVAGNTSVQAEPDTVKVEPNPEQQPEPVKESKGGRRVPVFGVSAQSTPVPAPAAPEPTPAPQPAPEPAPTPEVATPPTATPAPQPVPGTPEPAPTPTPEPQPAPAATQDNLARVQEIKREVIALVGNPVNLVAADNAVGKQYMSALLEAMKKINGGTRVEVAAAMQELEKAFAAVRGLAEHGMATPAVATPEPAPTPEPAAPAQPAPTTPAPQAVPAPAQAVTPATPEPAPTSAPAPESPTTPTPPPIPEELKAVAGVKENLVHDAAAIATEAVAQAPETATPQQAETPEEPSLGGAPLQDIPTYGFSKPSRTVFAKPNEKKADKTPTPPPAPKFAPHPTLETDPPKKSATKAEQQTKPSMVAPPKNAGGEPKQLNQDIHTPEITTGLQQLLSEWKIFKGSGLFGMGPGGIDHPLYQKIQNNTMLSIMNGTFDGATPEIQQSINDYINGWRYEQSIVPQHSETFDNFLRRVVRKVLVAAKQ